MLCQKRWILQLDYLWLTFRNFFCFSSLSKHNKNRGLKRSGGEFLVTDNKKHWKLERMLDFWAQESPKRGRHVFMKIMFKLCWNPHLSTALGGLGGLQNSRANLWKRNYSFLQRKTNLRACRISVMIGKDPFCLSLFCFASWFGVCVYKKQCFALKQGFGGCVGFLFWFPRHMV